MKQTLGQAVRVARDVEAVSLNAKSVLPTFFDHDPVFAGFVLPLGVIGKSTFYRHIPSAFCKSVAQVREQDTTTEVRFEYVDYDKKTGFQGVLNGRIVRCR